MKRFHFRHETPEEESRLGVRGPGGPRIRCPKCRWEPKRSDAWQCFCGHVWNTFLTRARCPSCDYVHPWTQCLRCGQRSAHEEWYEK